MKTLLQTMRTTSLLTLLALMLQLLPAKAQLVVNAPPAGPDYTALVQNFFVGQGVTVTNVSYVGATQQIGSFSNANTNLSLAGGIILTTGNRNLAIGPNNANNAGSNVNRPGLPELNALAGANTFDGAVLQFDFVAQSSSVSFQYIWASEEYPEYVNAGYNDAFSFFISGPGFGGPTNIALVPGTTTTPITIDNVNANSYSQYYVNNAGGQTIQYDGFTTTLTANAVIQPCQTYTLRICIADAGDHIYDSAVFLGQNSLTSSSVTVSSSSGYNGSTNGAYEGCLPGFLNFSIPQALTSDYTFNYTIGGTAQNGIDYQTIPTSVTIPAGQTSAQLTINAINDNATEGQESIIITVNNLCSVSTSTVFINDVAPLTVSAGTDQLQCGPPTAATLNATVSGGLAPYTYSWSNGTTVVGTTASITNTPTATTTYTVTATGACPGQTATDQVVVTVNPIPTSTFNLSAASVCNGQPVTATYSGNANSGATYNWSVNNGATIIGSGQGPISINYPAPGTYTVSLSVTQGGCTSTTVSTANVIVYPQPNSPLTAPATLCTGVNGSFNFTGTVIPGATYTWNFNGGTVVSGSGSGPYQINWTTAGTKTVSLTVAANGCTSTTTANVNVIQTPTSSFTATSPLCVNQNGTVTYTGTVIPGATYTWNFNGGTVVSGSGVGPYQISWATAGTKNVTLVVAANGCTSSTTTVPVVVNAMPTAAFASSTSPVCNGQALTVSATPVTGATYTWTVNNGANISGSGVGPVTVNYPGPGTYVVSLVVTANGCTSAAATSTVVVNPQPTAAFTAASPLCTGVNGTITYNGVPITGATYTWNFNGGTVVSGSGLGPYQVNWATAGTKTVTLTVAANGCSASSSASVVVNQMPTSNFSASAAQFCAGANGTITYNGTQIPGATYNWSFAGGTVVSGSGVGPYQVAWNTPGVKNITLTVTSNGCTSSVSTVPVTIYQVPTSSFTASASTICAGQPLSVTYNGNASSNATYIWAASNNATISGSGQGPVSVNYPGAGTYNITLNVVENGCSAGITSVPVTVNPQPTATFTATSPLCTGNNGTVTYTGTQIPGATYTWNFAGGTIVSGSGAGPYQISWATPGTKNVTLNVAAAGCTASSNVNVVVNQMPTSTFTVSNTQFCAGANATVTYSGTPVTGATYAWNFNGGTVVSGSGMGPYQIAWNTPGTKTITLTVTANGCNSTVTSIPVTIYQVPTSSFTLSSNSVCDGSPVNITYGGNASQNANYNWTVNNGGSIGQNPLRLIYPAAGTYNIGLTVTENGCSSATTNVTATVKPMPTSTFTVSNTQFCAGANATVTYSGTPVTGATYAWNFNGGTVVSGSGMGPYQIAWNTAGTKTITLTVTANGCVSTVTSVPVTIYQVPTSSFTLSSNSVCDGSPVNITYGGNASPNATYNWVVNNGGSIGQNPLRLIYAAAGTYNIGLTVTENGCSSATTNVTATVKPMPTSTFTVSNTQFCAGANATVTYSGTPITGATYAWNFNGGTVVSGSGMGPYQIAWSTPGTKTITLTVTANGCVSTVTSVPVTIYQIPTSSFTLSSNSVCDGSPVNITYGGNASPNATYNWTVNNGGSIGQNPLHLIYPGTGAYNIGLIVTENGCSSSATNVTATVKPVPVSTFSLATDTACTGSYVSISYNGVPVNNANYYWNFGGGLTQSGSGLGPYQIFWNTPGTKTVSLYVVANGCSSVVSTNTVVINQTPTATFNLSANTVCDGQPINLNYVGNASPNASYNWSADNGATIGSNPTSLVYPGPGTYIVSLNVVQNGCTSSTITRTAVVKPMPSSAFSVNNNQNCAGTQATVTYNGTPITGALYTWNFNGATVVSGSGMGPYQLTWNTPGVKTLTLSVSANGCTSPVTSIPVTVYTVPTSAFTLSSNNICDGQAININYTGNASPNATYNWVVNNGGSISQNPLQLAYPTTGTYNIALTVTENGCSSATTNLTATVKPQPVATFTAASPLCTGQNGTVTYTGNQIQGAVYTWGFNGGTIASGSGAGPYQINWATAGTKNVTLSINANGCTASANTQVVVNQMPTSTFTVSNTQFCAGANATVTFNGTQVQGANYAWNFDGGSVVSGSGMGPYQISWPTAGVKNVSLSVSANGCTTAVTTIPVTIYQVPTSSFSIAAPAICNGDDLAITYNGNASPNATYTWAVSNGGSISNNPLQLNYPSPGNYNITLNVTENGCSSTASSVPVTVHAIPTANFTVQGPICEGSSVNVVYTGTADVANAQFTWAWDGGIPTNTVGQNYSVQYGSAGNYNLGLTVVENGCSSITIERPLVVGAIPTSTFIATSPVCIGDNSVVTYTGSAPQSATYAWDFDGGTIASGQNQGPYGINWNTPGTKSLKLIVTNNGCVSPQTIVPVVVNSRPTAAFTIADTSICIGQPVTITYNGTASPNAIYNWTATGGATVSPVSGNTYQMGYPGAGVFTVTLSVTENGCASANPVSAQVAVYNMPTSAFIASGSPICTGTPLSLTYTGNASPNASYLWNINGGAIIGNLTPAGYPVNYPGAGVYNISLTVSENGCTSTQSSTTVVVNQTPTSAFITTANPVCDGHPVDFIYNGNASPNASYNWFVTNGANIVQQGADTFNLNYAGPGQYIVKLNITENGCASTESADTVNVFAVPVSAFAAVQNPVCDGQPVILNYGGSQIPGAVYTWTTPDSVFIEESGLSSYEVFYPGAGNYNVTLKVTANGCSSDSTTLPIIVNANPNAPFNATTAVCVGAEGNIVYTGPQDPNYSYQWNFDGGNVVAGSGPGPYQITWNAEGNKEVMLIVTNGNGCSSDTAMVPVTVNPIPSSNFSLSSNLCTDANGIVYYNGAPLQGAQYNWSFDNANIVSGALQGPYQLNWSTPGTKLVSLTVSANGCTSPITSLPVTVNQTPSAQFVALDSAVCEGGPITLVYNGNASPSANFEWYTTGGANVTGTGSGPFTVTYPAPGNYYVTLVVTENGCSSPISATLPVTIMPNPNAYFTVPTGECLGTNSYNFLAQGQFTFQADINWNFGPDANVQTSNIINPSNISFSSIGEHVVSLSVTDNGCTSNYSNTLQVYPDPEIQFSASEVRGCAPLEVQFTDNSGYGGLATYMWSFGDGDTSTLQNPMHIYTTAGTYSVSLQITFSAACGGTITQGGLVTVYPQAEAGFSVSPQVTDMFNPFVTVTNEAVGATNCYYTMGDGDTLLNMLNGTHEYAGAGIYTVTQYVSNSFGCADTAVQIVRVDGASAIYIPNAFTPNNDGINDAFGAKGIAVNNFTMYIFNRWGELIFTGNNIDDYWNGDDKSGKQSPNDVYVYKIYYTLPGGDKKEAVGTVALVD